jgi:hypothetical protein
VEGVGRRLALDLGPRRGVALDRRPRLLEGDVERDRPPVVDDLVLGTEGLRPIAEGSPEDGDRSTRGIDPATAAKESRS